MSAPQKIILPCLVAILTFIVSVSAGTTLTTRIAGGMPITIADAPYTVQLRQISNGWTFCAGTLVSPRFVVTAAHCFGVGGDFTDVVVLGAVSTLGGSGVERRIVDMIIHPEYQKKTLHSDLAVLKLDSDLKGANIRTVPLCQRPMQTGDLIQVSGWGVTVEGGELSKQLRTVSLPILPPRHCDPERYKPFTNGICALIPYSKNACSGDSGGPAINDGQLCGVVSFGGKCGTNSPTVFVDVYKMRDFIQKFMRK